MQLATLAVHKRATGLFAVVGVIFENLLYSTVRCKLKEISLSEYYILNLLYIMRVYIYIRFLSIILTLYSNFQAAINP